MSKENLSERFDRLEQGASEWGVHPFYKIDWAAIERDCHGFTTLPFRELPEYCGTVKVSEVENEFD